jgi:excisionase family DNA binding protein
MPPMLTPAEASPWTRLSRSVFYQLLASGDIASCRLGHSIRIPTKRFLASLGVLEQGSETTAKATDVAAMAESRREPDAAVR